MDSYGSTPRMALASAFPTTKNYGTAFITKSTILSSQVILDSTSPTTICDVTFTGPASPET
ncbi:hypothetical protein BGZ52_000892 [Haplosporangium bisporale]|nr:hypothetical protein BGZ52_000892 [Haplosporangium bisporale]